MPEAEQIYIKNDVSKIKKILDSNVEKIISLSKLLINDGKLQRHQVPNIKSSLSKEILQYEVLKKLYLNTIEEQEKIKDSPS